MISMENLHSWRRMPGCDRRLNLTFNEAYAFNLHHPGSQIPDTYYSKASGGIVHLRSEQIRSIGLNTSRDRFPRVFVEGQTESDIANFTDVLRGLNYQEEK